MSKPQNPVLLAKIGAPHGIKGQLRVTSYTEVPEDFGSYGPLFDNNGAKFTPIKCRPSKNVLITTFKEVTDREHAENLRGTELFIDRKNLPETIEEDEFYINDLIGLYVHDLDNKLIGTISNIDNFGAGDLLEIKPQNNAGTRGSWYLEFTRTNVPEIDFDKRRIIVNPPNEISERDQDDGLDGEPS